MLHEIGIQSGIENTIQLGAYPRTLDDREVAALTCHDYLTNMSSIRNQTDRFYTCGVSASDATHKMIDKTSPIRFHLATLKSQDTQARKTGIGKTAWELYEEILKPRLRAPLSPRRIESEDEWTEFAQQLDPRTGIIAAFYLDFGKGRYDSHWLAASPTSVRANGITLVGDLLPFGISHLGVEIARQDFIKAIIHTLDKPSSARSDEAAKEAKSYGYLNSHRILTANVFTLPFK